MEATAGAAVQSLLGGIDPEECIREFTPRVRRMAHRMKRRLPGVVEPDDLMQWGLVGLFQAAQRYQGPRERFWSFARLRIRGAMIDGLREADTAPRRLRRSVRHLQDCVRRLEQALARAPTSREIAAEMQLTPAQYHRLVQEQDAHKPVDLRRAEMRETMGCQDAAAQADPLYFLLEQCSRRQLLAAVSALPKRERRMLKLRVNRGLELRHIATLFGVTESRVCQLLSQAAARVHSRLAHA